jgi:hypothetical protein
MAPATRITIPFSSTSESIEAIRIGDQHLGNFLCSWRTTDSARCQKVIRPRAKINESEEFRMEVGFWVILFEVAFARLNHNNAVGLRCLCWNDVVQLQLL